MTGRLAGKVALVTGAGGDIGGATAALFAAEDAAVVLHDVAADAVAARAQAIETDGGRVRPYVCDVTNGAAVEEMFDEATATFGVVDVLVNCAGISGWSDPIDAAAGPLGLDDDAWTRMLAIHLNGSFFCTRAMVRRLLAEQRGGSVICISSIAGLSGWGGVHYSTAKGGLLGFVRSIARTCGSLGIRANAVCPGVIAEGMTKELPLETIEPLRQMTPLGRYGTSKDIAAACLYLAGDESAFVTGQWLSPNGGLVIA
jgi:3-oxoacyl-[acyl-carrier protein] reductase